jgi:hypothetical protein
MRSTWPLCGTDEHGVDGLGELSTAALIDATCVDPDVLVALLAHQLIAPKNFKESLVCLNVWRAAIANVLVQNLFILPSVRENGVFGIALGKNSSLKVVVSSSRIVGS